MPETGFSYPFRLNVTRTGPSVVTSEEELIRGDVRSIIMTDPAERPMCVLNGVPFGTRVNRLLFSSSEGAAATAEYEIRRALLVWEPRISVREVTATTEKTNTGRALLRIKVSYVVVATNKPDEVALSVDNSGGFS